FEYDFENRLVKVRKQHHHKKEKGEPEEEVITYSYDVLGRRIEKKITEIENDHDNRDDQEKECKNEDDDIKIIRYLYDGFDIVGETDENGRIIARYTRSGEIDEPLAMTRHKKTFYYHADLLGSISTLTDDDGDLVERMGYDSFGQFKHQGETGNPFAFTGREFDKETGFYYYRSRYYDPQVGRFISPDPIGIAGGLNLYTYVGNNPLSLSDPLGNKSRFRKFLKRAVNKTDKAFTRLGKGIRRTLTTVGRKVGINIAYSHSPGEPNIPMELTGFIPHERHFGIDVLPAMKHIVDSRDAVRTEMAGVLPFPFNTDLWETKYTNAYFNIFEMTKQNILKRGDFGNTKPYEFPYFTLPKNQSLSLKILSSDILKAQFEAMEGFLWQE
ncbi:MAG: RHS repeat-associated core domain-containing protein, partial [Planctomycetota bacterium]